MQWAEEGSRRDDSAGILSGRSQARAEYGPAWKRSEHKAAGEKGVRLGVIAAEQFGSAELDRVAAADQGEIVREFVAAQDGDVRDENVRSQVIDETRYLDPHLPGSLGITLKLL